MQLVLAWNWSFILGLIRQRSNRNTQTGVLIGRVSAMRYFLQNSPTRSLPQAINLLIESHRSIEWQFHKHSEGHVGAVLGSIRSSLRENLSQYAIRSGIQLALEFSGGAARLIHERRIEQQPYSVHKRSRCDGPRCAPSPPLRRMDCELFI